MKTVMLSEQELAERGITQLVHGKPLIKPESALAHKYLDGLRGVEIGPAAYQPFGLDTIAVATGDEKDRQFYRGIELIVCGGYVEMDYFAEADDLPFEDNSQGFVLSSHVLEHTPNPIACFVEWSRVVKDGGYIYIIVPKRENPYGDEGRMITPIEYYDMAWLNDWSFEKAFEKLPDKSTQPRSRGHLWVFDLESLLELVRFCNKKVFHLQDRNPVTWKLVEAHETDDKDNEGHMVLYRISK